MSKASILREMREIQKEISKLDNGKDKRNEKCIEYNRKYF